MFMSHMRTPFRVRVIVLVILSLTVCFLRYVSFEQHFLSSEVHFNGAVGQSNINRRLSFEWATVFPGVVSRNVPLECKFNEKRICCSALDDQTKHQDVGEGIPQDIISELQHDGPCITTKEYVASPYETRHYLKAKEIALHQDPDERHRLLLNFISSPEEVTAAMKWLARISVHMNANVTYSNSTRHGNSRHRRYRGSHGGGVGHRGHRDGKRRVPVSDDGDTHPDDAEYLSKFLVTTTCKNRSPEHWVEWIEPLTVHARHPFGMSWCRNYNRHYGAELDKSGVPDIPKVFMTNVDYILLQDSESLQSFEMTTSSAIRKTKKVLFDAGTSRFDSSLFWFTCAFSQRNIDFDSIFGWELSLLNPIPFWNHVPPRWKPRYHFFNKGISASPKDSDSVQTIAKQLGITKSDFVAFKLDIDTPEIEIPIAIDLLNENSSFVQLVDEFFFELHFQCEIMSNCGWGNITEEEVDGLRLDRPGALKFFGDVRRKGIRAHIWP